ncbi:MAG TPA: 5-formyltetrahydrofolate cyclo-ligase [Frankiaceae bacterium]|jgi:5-formyltetrahydrofolate cyclo-ligase|nr:5-formyltetrahydrofolate cyclo-ligase [Frankiaceae bacterium]
MSVETGKAALRKALLAARRERGADEGDSWRGVLAVPEVSEARVVAGYAALRGEPDIGTALEALPGRGVAVVLPVVLPDRDLEFRTPAGELVPLARADVVLVPALAADRAGHRLGRGGGSYDRALTRARPGALVVAVVHPEELLDSVPVEAHDIRVGAILAGAELIRIAPY